MSGEKTLTLEWTTTQTQRDELKKVLKSGCERHIKLTLDRIHDKVIGNSKTQRPSQNERGSADITDVVTGDKSDNGHVVQVCQESREDKDLETI